MKKKIATGFAVAAAVAVMAPSGASAAHCVSSDGTSPGFSWFGVHVQSDVHDREGRNPGHAGTPGASNCRDTSGSPSERAPGQL